MTTEALNSTRKQWSRDCDPTTSLDQIAFPAHDIRALPKVEAYAAAVASLAVDVPDYLGTQEFLIMIEV